jgi:thiol-disulfide isomerase/thioredoxin
MFDDSDDSQHVPVQVADPRPSAISAPSASLSKTTLPQTQEAQPRPTWGELVFQKQPIPLDESIQKTSREQALSTQQAARATGPNQAEMPATSDSASLASAPTARGVSCQFDPMERRLSDFQLPDVQGRMLSFHDFDSDLILLDFWGTWCAPCRKSIPHLKEIQRTLGGKKMQVIGIACERTGAKDRAAKVAQTIQQLKIDYPVLITGMDGTCPLQDAFQIQFYPTMVLLDRQGKILWREQGATDVTLARMDRFILKNLNRHPPGGIRHGGSGEGALQARMAGAKTVATSR